MSQFYTSGGQHTGVLASAAVLPMISFRMDWLDLLAVQGTIKSFLQHHSLKSSILWRSAFFTVQVSHRNLTLLLGLLAKIKCSIHTSFSINILKEKETEEELVVFNIILIKVKDESLHLDFLI